MAPQELCLLLDRRLVQYQYLDDCRLVAGSRALMVAGMALCVDWLLDRGLLRRLDRPNRRRVSH